MTNTLEKCTCDSTYLPQPEIKPYVFFDEDEQIEPEEGYQRLNHGCWELNECCGHVLEQVFFWVGVVTVILSISGILMNTIFCVLSSVYCISSPKKWRSVFNLLMIVLALHDSGYLLWKILEIFIQVFHVVI